MKMYSYWMYKACFSQHDTHERCFSCLGLTLYFIAIVFRQCPKDHVVKSDMSWNVEWWTPSPSSTGISSLESGLKRLGEMLGKQKQASFWFANWMMTFLQGPIRMQQWWWKCFGCVCGWARLGFWWSGGEFLVPPKSDPDLVYPGVLSDMTFHSQLFHVHCHHGLLSLSRSSDWAASVNVILCFPHCHFWSWD